MADIMETREQKCKEQGYRCGVCGKYITPYNSQLAHIVPQAKGYIKKYGKEVIHHPMNMVAVCSLRCNSAVLCDPKTHPIESQELIDKIKKDLS